MNVKVILINWFCLGIWY